MHRKDKAENASPADFAVELDAAAVSIHDVLDQKETQAGPALAGVSRGSIELLKDLLALCGSDANAVIFHLEHDLIAAATEADADVPGVPGVLHRIVDEVHDRLGDRIPIEADGGEIRFEVDGYRETTAGQELLVRLQRPRDDASQISRYQVVVLLASSDAGEVQDCVDQMGQALAFPEDDAVKAPSLFIWQLIAVKQRLTVEPDQGKRRLHEALERLDPEGVHDAVVNIQGDLPTIEPAAVAAVFAPLADPAVDIATLVAEITEPAERGDPNVVKAAVAFEGGRRVGRAVYFSRAPVPWAGADDSLPLYHHIGLYAFRRAALSRFVALPPSPLERRERLEQLRAIEAGMRIDAALVDTVPLGVDTPADLERARAALGAGA